MIRAWVRFSGGKTEPIIFEWRERRYNVKRIALVFDRRDGNRRFLCFAVDTGGMMAELALDRDNLVWKIVRAEENP